MTLAEVVISSVILAISSQVSLQGWSRTTEATARAAQSDQQLWLLEQRLLASRRALAMAPVRDAACRWDGEAVVKVLDTLPEDAALSPSWRLEPLGDGVWLTVELKAAEAEPPIQRSQLFTPAGLGHCPREVSDVP